MKAIILAAGIGSRLRPMTNNKPKTLVEVNGKPMLKYIIDSLVENNIGNIVVCTGFQSREIINFCKTEYPFLNFTFVDNKDFETTNNLYTLYLARDLLDEEFILMNADIVFDSQIITNLVSFPESAICVDEERYIEESMKITVREDGTIKNISKQINKSESYGCSIDIYKFMSDDVHILKEKLIEVIEIENHKNEWTERLLDTLMSTKSIKMMPLTIKKSRWYEIDDHEDLLEAEKIFNTYIGKLEAKRTFVLDLDGTLCLGNELINGSKEFINNLLRKDKNIYVLTNNSSKPPSFYKNKLINMGLANNIEVISSLDLAINFFKKKNLTRVYWVANKEVDEYLRKMNLEFDDKNPQGLLLTYDTEINYNKLLKLTALINRGLPYYATHTDIVCPTEWGYNIPDIGSYIELIKLTTGLTPQKTFGKPNLFGIQYIQNENKVDMSEMVMIGDRLYTDIKMANNTDIVSVLVLSGETTREVYEVSSINADIVVKNVHELCRYI